MIEKKIKLGNLFDFYGQLLTAKQQGVLNLYCMHDLSLGEISENLSVSRQAVNDAIRKCEKILDDYESKLGLQEKFKQREDNIQNIVDDLDIYIKNDKMDNEAIKLIKDKVIKCLE